MQFLLLIAGFIACSATIVFSGSRLSKYGDIMADLTGMGKVWLGLILMAAITSLPEMITGISSITIIDAPDIAAGDVMGSCAFNLLILAVLDYFVPGKPLSSVVTKSHAVGGFFGIFLLTFSVISIAFAPVFPMMGWISSSSLLMIILYAVSIRFIFKNEQRQHASATETELTQLHKLETGISLPFAIRQYVLFALLVIAAATALPYFADRLAQQSGLSRSFVGTLLVAATTSLPEMVVSVTAVRRGSVDIAVGNLLGSNIFNMLILAFDDLFYTKGSLFVYINPDHALSGLVALLMTSVAGISILYSTPHKKWVLGSDAIVLIVLYILLMLALYQMT